MTPRSAKRLKASVDVKKPLGSPMHPTYSELRTTSPDLGHSAPRKKRKRQFSDDDNVAANLDGVAPNLSAHTSMPIGYSEGLGQSLPDVITGMEQGNKSLKYAGLSADAQGQGTLSNLELVRMLQNPKVPRSRKIEVAYDFTRSEHTPFNEDHAASGNLKIQGGKVHSMAMAQFVSFLSEWVQSAVLWSSKPQQLTRMPCVYPAGEEREVLLPAYLDARYWAILRWCLSCGYLHKSASVSTSMMRSLNLYVMAVVKTVGSPDLSVDRQLDYKIPSLSEDSVSSIQILLLANERSFRPDIDHWVSLAAIALSKLASSNKPILGADEQLINPVRRLLVLILEGFARFVTIHTNRRKIFTCVVENLLEALLICHACLSGQCSQVSDCVSIVGHLSWHQRVLKAIEGILERGLFDPAQINSFQEVCTVLARNVDSDSERASMEKQSKNEDSRRDFAKNVEGEDRDMHVSYHKLLFQKLEYFRREEIELALMELGWVYKIYSKSFRSQQKSGDIDVFGVRSRGKPLPLETYSNNGLTNDPEGEGSLKTVTDTQLVDKKQRGSENLFNVFAEFVGPLMKDLRKFQLSLESSEPNVGFQHLRSARVLVNAVTGILEAAKNGNTYMATEDIASHIHFTFLDKCFTTFVEFGKVLPKFLRAYVAKLGKTLLTGSSKEDLDGQRVKELVAEILGKVIIAIKYLMDLEYRVAENWLGDVWMILLTEVALQQSSRGRHVSLVDASVQANQESIAVACQIVSIFSDLRQVDRAFFSLCATLRGFVSQGSLDSFHEKESSASGSETKLLSEGALLLRFLNLEAVELLVCSKLLLSAIATAMHVVPEGQVAEFLNMLRIDALESISLIDIGNKFIPEGGSGSGEGGSLVFAVALKGLVELYCHMLENINITASNSVQAGKAVRQILAQIVTPKLAQLVDVCMHYVSSKESDTMAGDAYKKRKFEKKDASFDAAGKQDAAGSLKTTETESHLSTWNFVFLLRLYMTSQSLHRECVSVMPPKAARKASSVLDGPVIDYQRFDIKDTLILVGGKSFLSAMGRGSVKVSELLAGIERRLQSRELLDHPALRHALDCIALQSLVELSRQIDGLSFLVVRYEELRNVMSNGDIQQNDPVAERFDAEYFGIDGSITAEVVEPGVRKQLQKLLKTLKLESQILTKILLKGIELLVDTGQDNKATSEISSSPGYRVLHELDFDRGSTARLTKMVQQPQFLPQDWDSVEVTLSGDTLSIQRWQLLCRTLDIWAKHAVDGDLKKFLVFVFTSSSSLGVQKIRKIVDDVEDNQGSTAKDCNINSITNDLLSNAFFYEEESIRRVFTSTFLEELKKSLRCAFDKWLYDADSSDDSLKEHAFSHDAEEWTDFVNIVEAEIRVRGPEQDTCSVLPTGYSQASYFPCSHASGQLGSQHGPATPKKHNLKTLLSASKKQGSNLTTSRSLGKQSKSKDLIWDKVQLRALDLCVGLVDHLSGLPSGYIKSSDATLCANVILYFERLLMVSLLHLRAIVLADSHGSGTPDLAGFSIVHKLLKAFTICRKAVLALTSPERAHTSHPSAMAVLEGGFGLVHWLSLSIQVAATCVVDLLQCSSLPVKERKHVLSSEGILLHKLLTSTASLVTCTSEASLMDEAKRTSHPGSGPVPIETDLTEEDLDHVSHSADQEKETSILNEVMSYQAQKLDQLVRSTVGKDLISSPGGQFQANEYDASSAVAHSSKSWYSGLALAASLCGYVWSFTISFQEFAKESTAQKKPLCLEPLLGECAQKLGHVLTGTLLSVLLPVGSHAVSLLGELEVDIRLTSREDQSNFIVISEVHQQPNSSTMMVDKKDEDRDDDHHDCLTAVDTAMAKKDEDEDEDKEEMEVEGHGDYGRHSTQQLDGLELVKTNEFGKYGSVAHLPRVLYTEKSKHQRSLLENLLEVCCSEKCEVIGELYLAMAGLLKLESIKFSSNKMALGSSESRVEGGHSLSPAINVLMGAGHWLLLRASDQTEPDQWSHLGWLVGVVKYLESTYYLLPYLKPSLTPLAFSKLFSMHFHLLGSLPRSEVFALSFNLSNPLDIEEQKGISIDYDSASDRNFKDEGHVASPRTLRNAVKGSLGVLLQTASRHHSVLALQAIMRALVGASEDSSSGSGLEIWGLEGGKVGSGVAAGIDCLSIALEAFSGTKRLRLLANHFNEFFGAIFNLIEYLQGPQLFLKQEPHVFLGEPEFKRGLGGKMVNSGPVILQALQILITAASRDTIFPMRACHVALALHCPARIFWPVHHSGLAKLKFTQSYSVPQQPTPEECKGHQLNAVVQIGTELGVKLYVSCCRLLCSIIRHRRRESGHCIALLGDSAHVLLQCLEAPNWPASDKGGARVSSVKMAAYCASWLGRVYEQMGEHKETLGKYCSHILSDYLSVLAGHGPLAAGLTREVEAVLQPGAYVLVDACSANDLQQLHASLGEGPRRNALLNLRRQYQQQFKYTGKVPSAVFSALDHLSQDLVCAGYP